MGDNLAAVGRHQVERGDLGAFLHPLLHLESALATPAAFGLGRAVVDAALGGDQDVGQLLVGSTPGGQHLVGGDLGTQHLADGAQQASADDGVVLGLHLQRHMLVDDLRGQIAQGSSLSMCLAYISTL